jgi:hypothetical protein
MKQRFIITGKIKGKEIEPKEVILQRSQDYHVDMKYTDFFEKCFTFSTPILISGIRFNKTPHAQPDTSIEDIYNKMTIQYKRSNKWYPLQEYQEVKSMHPGFEQIKFKPVEAEALKFVNNEPDDLNFYLNKIWVNEEFRESYHIRVTKLKDQIIFFIDGKEVTRLKNDFPASQVGLTSTDAKANFNGITLFHLPL